MTKEEKNEYNITGLLSDLLPSKDPFWRRFFVWWIVFNWRLVYITLFVGIDNVFYTKLDYLRHERFLLFDTQKDISYIFLTFVFGILLPYMATKIYYKKWFQRNIIHPIYETYAVSESNKSNILEKTAQVDRENIYYEKLKKHIKKIL